MAHIRQGLAQWRGDSGESALSPWVYALLADAYSIVRQVEEGLQVVDDALALVDEHGVYGAALYHLKGELLLAQSADHQPAAESCFHQALEVSRHQQAKALELRAATSLSRLWKQQGKRDEARELLGEVYGWFTEGFATKDVQDAKTLLDELRGYDVA